MHFKLRNAQQVDPSLNTDGRGRMLAAAAADDGVPWARAAHHYAAPEQAVPCVLVVPRRNEDKLAAAGLECVCNGLRERGLGVANAARIRPVRYHAHRRRGLRQRRRHAVEIDQVDSHRERRRRRRRCHLVEAVATRVSSNNSSTSTQHELGHERWPRAHQ